MLARWLIMMAVMNYSMKVSSSGIEQLQGTHQSTLPTFTFHMALVEVKEAFTEENESKTSLWHVHFIIIIMLLRGLVSCVIRMQFHHNIRN